jgi:hypothetical protein
MKTWMVNVYKSVLQVLSVVRRTVHNGRVSSSIDKAEHFTGCSPPTGPSPSSANIFSMPASKYSLYCSIVDLLYGFTILETLRCPVYYTLINIATLSYGSASMSLDSNLLSVSAEILLQLPQISSADNCRNHCLSLSHKNIMLVLLP